MTPWVPSALVNHLWQSTLFVIIVWLTALALRNNRARVRCRLWTAASVKFLVPLSTLVSLGERFQWRTPPAAVQPARLVHDAGRSGAGHRGHRRSGIHPAIAASVAVATAGRLVCGCGRRARLLGRQWLPIRAALRRATPLRLDPEYGAADLALMSSPSMPEPGVVGICRPRLLLPRGHRRAPDARATPRGDRA
jgi:hypothetical protein